MPTELDNQSPSIADRVEGLRNAIRDAAISASRSPDDILLLAVSKMQNDSRLKEAYDAGLRDFGENYLQGLQRHQETLAKDVAARGHLRWHFIGHLQSNKAKGMSGVHLIHSVDSLKLARILGAAATKNSRIQACLLNVNISEQESKSGVLPSDLESLLDSISSIAGIDIQGLMCIPNPDEEARAAFSRLRILRDRVQAGTDYRLRELSMGMSGSFREAIAEGATILRIGTSLFGPRET